MIKKTLLLTLTLVHFGFAQTKTNKPCTFLFEGSSDDKDICLHIQEVNDRSGKFLGKIDFYFWKKSNHLLYNPKNEGNAINIEVAMPIMQKLVDSNGNPLCAVGGLTWKTWVEDSGLHLRGGVSVDKGLYVVCAKMKMAAQTDYNQPSRQIDLKITDKIDQFYANGPGESCHIFYSE